MAIRVGIAGACRRGGSFAAGLRAAGFRVTAVCDVDAEGLPAAAARIGARQQYLDYERMLDEAEIDAVVIGTPMQYHAPMAIAALERGIHVLSEVPAAVSRDECRALVRASKASTAAYMMAENYLYRKDNVLVAELVRRGLFGQVYYAEGEYVHELKELNEDTPWRRTWQTGVGRPELPASPTAPTASGRSCSGCRATAWPRCAAPIPRSGCATRAATSTPR